MDPLVLAVNPGSSSHEFGLFKNNQLLLSAYYEHLADGLAVTLSTDQNSETHNISQDIYKNALGHFLDAASKKNINLDRIEAAGIRLVAPGRRFLAHQPLTEDLISYIDSITERAPLHLAAFNSELGAIKSQLGQNVQVYAISDSEFHKSLYHEARNYAIPRLDADKYDIYRFGFHGLSVQSVINQLNKKSGNLPARIIVCHLGSGASVTAVLEGQSVDTSMGYSPLEGLVMATRSGSIDIEAVMQLQKSLGLNSEELLHYLNHSSGLLGLSQSSGDIRTLLADESSGSEPARLALDTMTYRVRQYIGSYLAILGGLDALIFTATVGERSDVIRRRICDPLAELGFKLDDRLNSSDNPQTISADDSQIDIKVIPADELGTIAAETFRLTDN